MNRSRVSVSREMWPRSDAPRRAGRRGGAARGRRRARARSAPRIAHGDDRRPCCCRPQPRGKMHGRAAAYPRRPARRAGHARARSSRPAPHLRAELRERLGVEVSDEVAAAAMKAEIAYYRAHLHEGRDAASLADLRRRAAEAMRPGARRSTPTSPTRCSPRCASAPIRTPRPRCASCARAGCALVVVSNWDHSLHERLEETGLAPLVDGAVASAELGHAKPDPAIFEHALGSPACDARRGAARRRLAGGRRARERWPPGCGRCSSRATDRPPAPPGVTGGRSLAELPACANTLEGRR